VEKLVDGVYTGRGGVGAWGGIIIGDRGVIVVDPQETPAQREIMFREIEKLTPLPVTHVILTHANPDHVRGIFGLPRDVVIMGHENLALEMDLATKFVEEHPWWRYYLPTFVYDKRADLKIHGVNITLLHWAPAHTSGDTSIYLPDKKLVFIGDLGNDVPNVHLENFGSSEGMFETLRGLIALDAEIYQLGHGNKKTKADMQKILDNGLAMKAKVKQLVEQGKTFREVRAAMGENVTPVSANITPPRFSFVGVLYREITGKPICEGTKGGLPACSPNYSWADLKE
jgi:glyoxylase-like metal-dependent hydrolase (beta-lactamase superfamily II)